MAFKHKLIGLVLLIVGAWPFILKISSVAAFFSTYKFLSYVAPGEIGYQIIIILLAVLLLWRKKAKTVVEK